jgi:superfamily II DNA or RNA helicase
LEERGSELIMPRGFIRQFIDIVGDVEIDDRTRVLPEVEFNFQGTLDTFEENAIQDIMPRRFGILNAPPGSGKTVMALNVIGRRRQPTLVIVHTKELLYQWQERAQEFLGLPELEIGLIGDGKKEIGEVLTIAVVNSLYKCAAEIKDHFGNLIVDEVHRTPARTFTEAVSAFDSRYMLGLSATPYRRDGLTRVIYFYCGEEVHRIDPDALQEQQKIMKPSLKVRHTDFDYPYNDDYQLMLTELVRDEKRNDMIVEDVLAQANGHGIALALSDRKEHCKTLYDLFRKRTKARLLTGDVAISRRKAILGELKNGQVNVLVATSQLIGEGFDVKALSSLFLTTPIRFTGKLKQCAGRILRTDDGKKAAVIFDYVDRAGVLQASFESRCSAYEQIGIEIQKNSPLKFSSCTKNNWVQIENPAQKVCVGPN